MLIEFSTTNFWSIRDRQTFSLVKDKGGELTESNTFETRAYSKFELLRSAAIYGPNSSGKTSLLRALNTMQNIVLESATTMYRSTKLPVTPFRLRKKTLHEPSEFEIEFIVNSVRYRYGFSATQDRIHDEWLLAYPNGKSQHWFDRSWNQKSESYDWYLGGKLTGKKDVWQESTRDNALFLSTAVHFNSEQLRPIHDWFNDTLRLASADHLGPEYSASVCETEKKTLVLDFLCAADLSIEDVIVESKPYDIDKVLPSYAPDDVRKNISDQLKGEKMYNIQTVHKDEDGNETYFDFSTESQGTQKIFASAGPWIDTLQNGYVLFVDELHNSLHPKLVQFLIGMFHNSNTNPKNAQLVFTTHETSILHQKEFRRDQIWFCEKEKDQSTTIYPLTDFRPRKGRENLELTYLSGRYGALPYVRPLEKLA